MVRSQHILRDAATTATVLVTRRMCAGRGRQQQQLRCWQLRRWQLLLPGLLDRRLVVVLTVLVGVVEAVVVRLLRLVWYHSRKRHRH